ncbi:MAG: RnfABCDGE type electron transport complex subunit D [Snowella sp.]|nr:RnfABCDGE type electron transport complex subunit D [Snowella sp.]
MAFQDARDYQILFLCSFLMLGIFSRDWTVNPLLMAAILSTCVLAQGLFLKSSHFWGQSQRLNGGIPESPSLLNFSSLKSSLITGLGLCLLLRANQLDTVILAAGLAIASKFVFRFRGKHFFNPANFGIIAALILTQDAWISPGQWGTDWWYLLLFLSAGGLVLNKVGRWDTSVVFLGIYSSLEAIRNYWLGWDSDVLFHHLSSGSLLVFALFMLTDPRSMPNATISRLIWASGIAVVTFILQYTLYLPTAMFWALFCFSPLTLLFDSHWFAPRFTWQKLTPLSPQFNR